MELFKDTEDFNRAVRNVKKVRGKNGQNGLKTAKLVIFKGNSTIDAFFLGLLKVLKVFLTQCM